MKLYHSPRIILSYKKRCLALTKSVKTQNEHALSMVNYVQVTLIGLGIYVQSADNLHNIMVPN